MPVPVARVAKADWVEMAEMAVSEHWSIYQKSDAAEMAAKAVMVEMAVTAALAAQENP